MPNAQWRSWIILGALSLLLFLITASTFSSLGVVLPAMIKELKWNFASAFLGFTLLGAFCGGSSWLPAMLIRRIGVRATILIGSAVMVAGFGCLTLAHGLPVYLAGTALLGVGYQMMALIPATHLLSMLFKKRALPFGIYFTTGSLGGVTAVSLAPSHFSELGVASTVAVAALSLESLMQVAARMSGGLLADRIDPRWLLAGAQGMMAVGLVALAGATTWPLMMVFALGVGVGFGMTVLAVSILLLNYYGRKNNLELFSMVCMVGAVSALGPVIGGFMRDRLGGFAPTFQVFAAVIGVIFVAALFMRPPRKSIEEDVIAPAPAPSPILLRDAA